MNTATTPKRERLEARLTSDQKQRIQYAADLSGRSLTDFVVNALEEAASETIREHTDIRLTTEDSIRFVEALLSPPEPNESLRLATRRYREIFGE